MRKEISSIVCVIIAGALLMHAQPPKAKKKVAAAPVPAAMKQAAQAHAATGCDPTLWDHVYHKQRLVIVAPCISITGTIKHMKPEADGDEHIQLLLDPGDNVLLNNLNMTKQHGALVIEPVCEGPVTQPDAIAACRDFHSEVDVPTQKKARVTVLGSYVLDQEADHGWMEIHPVTSMTVVQ